MSSYIEPIRFAFLIFPLIAFLITIPYLIYQYHKYGSVPLIRSIIIYTFILYLINIYFLVILPLPSKKMVSLMKPRVPQLIPFQFIINIIEKQPIIWNDFSSYISFIKSPAVYTVIFNILLTIPLGIYLKYYFQKKWYQILFISFGVSLFFELTQLTGLYGIYEKPYRLFDVDDLLMNTLGGIVGMLIAPVITKFLPSREKIDQISYEKGQSVSIYRRGIAYLIDCFFCMSIILVLLLFFKTNQIEIAYIISAISYFGFLPCITGGQTIGKYIVKIKLTTDYEKYKIFHIFIRQILLHIILFGSPYIICLLLKYSQMSFFIIFISLILIFYNCKLLIQVLKALLFKNKLIFYEKITKTKNISMIELKE